MDFPQYRPRRLRANETIRRMVRETTLLPDNFIYPLFVTHGKGVRKEISSMPGNYQQSIDNLVKDCEEVSGLGIPAVILFGIPEHKDELVRRPIPTRGSSSTRSRPSKTSCPSSW